MPPVPGTPSYEAAQLSQQYFPSHNLNLAVLAKSAGEAAGQPLVRLVNESTCRLKASVDFSNLELDITCEPTEENALGGGCITKAGVVNQTGDLVESIVGQLPLPASMKAKIEEEIEQFIPQLVKSLPNISRCPVRSNVPGLTDAWLALGDSVNATMMSRFGNGTSSDCDLTVATVSAIPAQTLKKTLTVPVPGIGNLSLTAAATLPPGEFWDLLSEKILAEGPFCVLRLVSPPLSDFEEVFVHIFYFHLRLIYLLVYLFDLFIYLY